MGDWGMRISNTGIDVKTGADKDMSFTSKYPCLKGNTAFSGVGTASCPQNGVWTNGVTINHNLGYIPMLQAFARDRDGDYYFPYYYPCNFLDYSVGTEIYWQCKADATNAYVRFWYDDFGFGGANVDIEFAYFLFIDKGKA